MVVVTVVVVVGRGDWHDRVVVAIVEVFRGRRLVIVMVLVSEADEAAGLRRIAGPAIARQRRIGAERSGKDSHAVDHL